MTLPPPPPPPQSKKKSTLSRPPLQKKERHQKQGGSQLRTQDSGRPRVSAISPLSPLKDGFSAFFLLINCPHVGLWRGPLAFELLRWLFLLQVRFGIYGVVGAFMKGGSTGDRVCLCFLFACESSGPHQVRTRTKGPEELQWVKVKDVEPPPAEQNHHIVVLYAP